MLVIFDWDGTIADTTGRIVRSLAAASVDCQVPVLSDDQYCHIIGLGLDEAILALYPEQSQAVRQRIRAAYSHHFFADTSPTQLYDGVRVGLSQLQQQGYLLAVATGKSAAGLDRVLSELEMHDLFEITRGADQALSKPNPLMLQHILSHTALTPDQALMVGDTTFDLQMAKNAQMRSIGVSYGAHHPNLLVPLAPVRIVSRFSEVVNTINAVLPLS